MSKKTYLGDGLYASDDGFHIILTAPRADGEHHVALDSSVLQNFIRFVENSRNLKITVVSVDVGDGDEG